MSQDINREFTNTIKKHIKEIINTYIKRIIKDLNEKTFKYYIYIEYYDVILDLV